MNDSNSSGSLLLECWSIVCFSYSVDDFLQESVESPFNQEGTGSDSSLGRDSSSLLENEGYGPLNPRSRHVPHKSLLNDTDFPDNGFFGDMDNGSGLQDSYMLDNPDFDRGYRSGYGSSRTLLSPMNQNPNFGFNMSESFRGHRSTLSLLGTNGELGMKRYEPSFGMGQPSDYNAPLLSEPASLFRVGFAKILLPFPHTAFASGPLGLSAIAFPHAVLFLHPRLLASSAAFFSLRPTAALAPRLRSRSASPLSLYFTLVDSRSLKAESGDPLRAQQFSPRPIEREEFHAKPVTQEPGKKLPYACRDFRNGKCTRGDACKFMHVMESGGSLGLTYR